jgi:RNA polymerase sigma-70 factor (ECF subfamily)
VREIQRGVDRERNFQRLYQLYSPGLYHFLLHCGVSGDDALDLIQETFVRVYQHVDRFRFDSSFKTWLFEIARNLWRNDLRSRAAEKRRGEEVSLGDGDREGIHLLEHRAITPEAALPDLLAAEEAAQLHQAVGQLPPQMRRCVQLFFQGLSYPQIARVMQTEAATVKSQMYQARQRLRAALGEYFNPYDFDPGGPA